MTRNAPTLACAGLPRIHWPRARRVAPLLILAASLLPLAARAGVDADFLQALVDGDEGRATQLLKRVGNVNARDKDGNTALILASFQGYTTIVKRLLARGASLDLEDHDGANARVAAQMGKHNDIEQLLIARGAALTKGEIATGRVYEDPARLAAYKAAFNSANAECTEHSIAACVEAFRAAGLSDPLPAGTEGTDREALWADAQERLGWLYWSGPEAERSTDEARKYFQRATEVYLRRIAAHQAGQFAAMSMSIWYTEGLIADTPDHRVSEIWLSELPVLTHHRGDLRRPNVLNLPKHVVDEINSIYAEAEAKHVEGALCFPSEYYLSATLQELVDKIHDNRPDVWLQVNARLLGASDSIDVSLCERDALLHDVVLHTHPPDSAALFSGQDLFMAVTGHLMDVSPFRFDAQTLVRGPDGISLAFPGDRPVQFSEDVEQLSRRIHDVVVPASLFNIVSHPTNADVQRFIQSYRQYVSVNASQSMSEILRRLYPLRRAISLTNFMPTLDNLIAPQPTARDAHHAVKLASQADILHRFGFTLYSGGVDGALWKVTPQAYVLSQRGAAVIRAVARMARSVTGEAPISANFDRSEARAPLMNGFALTSSEELVARLIGVYGEPYETPFGTNFLGLGRSSVAQGSDDSAIPLSHFEGEQLHPWIVTSIWTDTTLELFLTRYQVTTGNHVEAIEGAPAAVVSLAREDMSLRDYGTGSWHAGAFDVVLTFPATNRHGHFRATFADRRRNWAEIP